MTTQFHAKELLSDLGNITYPHELSKIQVKLVGKIWIDRIKLIRDELNRFEQTVVEKNDLEKALAEQKKKILMLEKEIKDRQTTK